MSDSSTESPSEGHGVIRHDPIQGDIIHEYDGIEEADNHLPTWWLWTFYGAIIFGVLYWFYYHEFDVGPLAPEEYATAVAERAAAGAVDEETLVALAGDPGTLAAGEEVFSTTCAACHGENAGGQIGPNLTDNAWLHGGSAMEIHSSIQDGITAEEARVEGSAGMPGWGQMLGGERINAVTAYVLSLRDTNADGRDPEGEPYDPAGE